MTRKTLFRNVDFVDSNLAKHRFLKIRQVVWEAFAPLQAEFEALDVDCR